MIMSLDRDLPAEGEGELVDEVPMRQAQASREVQLLVVEVRGVEDVVEVQAVVEVQRQSHVGDDVETTHQRVLKTRHHVVVDVALDEVGVGD